MLVVLVSITLSEAASILGVSPSASKEEINTAYRSLIAKYHPDANRTKSESEQKQAEKMFKQVGTARKVMLNPSMAAPEPVDLDMTSDTTANPSSSSTYSSAYPNNQRSDTGGYNNNRTSRNSDARSASSSRRGYSSSTQKPNQSYHASADRSKYSPQGYNKATTFNDGIPKVADPAEEQLAQIYDEEAREEYLAISDKARLTPSWAVSIAYILFSLVMFFSVPLDLSKWILSDPYIIFILVCLGKMIIYDTFISYYAYKALSKIIRYAWGIICGIETSIMGIVGMFLLMGPNGIPELSALILFAGIIAGIVIAGASFAISKMKKKK